MMYVLEDRTLSLWIFILTWPCLIVQVCDGADSSLTHVWWFWFLMGFLALSATGLIVVLYHTPWSQCKHWCKTKLKATLDRGKVDAEESENKSDSSKNGRIICLTEDCGLGFGLFHDDQILNLYKTADDPRKPREIFSDEPDHNQSTTPASSTSSSQSTSSLGSHYHNQSTTSVRSTTHGQSAVSMGSKRQGQSAISVRSASPRQSMTSIGSKRQDQSTISVRSTTHSQSETFVVSKDHNQSTASVRSRGAIGDSFESNSILRAEWKANHSPDRQSSSSMDKLHNEDGIWTSSTTRMFQAV